MSFLTKDPDDPALGGNMIGGDPQTYHPALWSFLIDRFRVSSMLDVGCGEGHCVEYFTGVGVQSVGFDGLKRNVEEARVPIVLHDLRRAAIVLPVDLVHCCEVVEQIDEQFLPRLLSTLANGRVIAMTHALPAATALARRAAPVPVTIVPCSVVLVAESARSRRDAPPASALCCHAWDAGCARVGMRRPTASFTSAAMIPGECGAVSKKMRRRSVREKRSRFGIGPSGFRQARQGG